jgi:hypothetical protein
VVVCPVEELKKEPVILTVVFEAGKKVGSHVTRYVRKW